MHDAKTRPAILVITPSRNEARTIERTIASMRAQTVAPVRWVIVDDGSTDDSPEIMARAAREVPWIQIATRVDRGFRKVGGGVIGAFYAGLEVAKCDYDFIVKLDADLEFSPRYIERLLDYFEEDPLLAAASGKVYREEDGRLIEESIIDEQVSGAFKFYRREAFEKIGGFVREVMWDGIDFHRARMEGYRTASFRDPELQILHLRLMGSSDRSILRGRLRWGRGQWFMGSAFPYVVASGVFRMREKPLIIGGLFIIAGYLYAAIRGDSRYGDSSFRQALRSWQYDRLKRLMRGETVS
jgi:biofilm PGA synthesis N-glycosyltransferase PgaC